MRLREDWLPRPIDQRLAELEEAFRSHFGRRSEGIAQAPGRVNLIGEHLDYNGGLVLPVAIDRSVLVAFAPRDDGDLCVYSSDFGQESTFRLGAQTQDGGRTAWVQYVYGVCQVLTEAGKSHSGVDLAISGDVLVGAGLSSSAALEVATAGALRAAWQLDLDDKHLALLCRRAENDFVGVQCGVMDQLASALGRAGHALVIDCRSLKCDQVRLRLSEQGTALVVIDSGQRRRLEQSEYNRRRDECAEALALLRSCALDQSPAALRDVTMDDLTRVSLPSTLMRRVRHVVTEQARVEFAVAALRSGNVERFGMLMNESHASLRDNFEVSTPEVDWLVDLAQMQPGVLGARLTGAGFGGCTVNLVREDSLGAFATDVVERYASETQLPARLSVCRPSGGLRVHSSTHG